MSRLVAECRPEDTAQAPQLVVAAGALLVVRFTTPTSEWPTRGGAERLRSWLRQEGYPTMRQPASAAAVAAVAMLVVSCGSSNPGGTASSSTTTTTTTQSKPPLAQAALANLLLTQAEVDSALGVTGSQKTASIDQLRDDNFRDMWPNGYKFPDECLYIFGPAQAASYAGSGNTAVQGETDRTFPPPANDPDIEVDQVVVLFPSAEQARAFFTTSSERWRACANRQVTTPGGVISGPPDVSIPETVFKVGPVSNADGVLSYTVTTTPSKGGTTTSQNCQRVLTVRNNVVIDAEACRNKDLAGGVAVNVANLIAGKVDKQ